jgi:hypothetical protein
MTDNANSGDVRPPAPWALVLLVVLVQLLLTSYCWQALRVVEQQLAGMRLQLHQMEEQLDRIEADGVELGPDVRRNSGFLDM